MSLEEPLLQSLPSRCVLPAFVCVLCRQPLVNTASSFLLDFGHIYDIHRNTGSGHKGNNFEGNPATPPRKHRVPNQKRHGIVIAA